jgi:chemotaxis protein CheD
MDRIERFNPAALPAEFVRSVPRSGAGASTKFLLPGQMFTSDEPMTVTTILGSCVAVCLWSPAKGIGGMNHYLLPEGSATEANRLRYGNNANPALLQEVLSLGGVASDLRAKVFGGATIMASADPALSLGKRNMELALEFLKANRIHIVERYVSERRGCKLIFQTNDGSTQLKTFDE